MLTDLERERLTTRLQLDESLQLKPYRCTAGKLTIGYGRNLEDKGLSEPECKILLVNDIDWHLLNLPKYLPFFDTLPQQVQAVLINMSYNLGLKGLLGFKKMIEAVAKGDYATASYEMLQSKWAHQVGARADRLSVLMRTGREPS